jgi:AraC-like DNA-binding protein
MASRIHNATQHRVGWAGVDAMTLASNHHFPRHAHDQFGMGLMAFGAQRSWSGIGAVDAEAGDMIMVNPGEIHDGIPLGEKARGWRIIYFEPATMAGLVHEEFSRPVEIARPVARDPFLAQSFARLFVCLTDPWPDALRTEECMIRALIRLLRRHGVAGPRFRQPSPSVTQAIRRLHSAPQEPVTLAELAALAGVSRFQLLRGFVREMGITPHAYLVQLRVRLARRLLAQGQTPAQTAPLAGFADQSHLTRAFVRQCGITPGRYRQARS